MSFQIRTDEEFEKRLEALAGKAGLDKSKYIRNWVMNQPIGDPLSEAEEQLKKQLPFVITCICNIQAIRNDRKNKAEIDLILSDTKQRQDEIATGAETEKAKLEKDTAVMKDELNTLAERISLYCKRNSSNPELRAALIRLRDLVPMEDSESTKILHTIIKVLEPDKQQELDI
jgi:hypothetical protein